MPGLSLEQGPPLSIPLSFFLSAPIALFAAAALLLLRADDGVVTTFAPSNVALVHLCGLGFLLLVMIGALYQLLPVVAGALVPRVRLAHLVHALLVAGIAALVLGQFRSLPAGFAWGAGLLTAGMLAFLAPAAWALGHSRVTQPTARGLRLSLLALLAVAALGVRMALTRGGLAPFAGDWLTLRAAHAALALLVFTGGLVAAVSWQVVPMFFLTAPAPRWLPPLVQLCQAASLLALLAIALLDAPSWSVPLAAAPAAIALWLVQPAWAAFALRGRKRRRRDATLYGWWLSLALSPLCFTLGTAAGLSDDPALPLLFGLVVLWGQAGLLAHAMLTRIVPFLVYLHCSAPLVVSHRMRSAKELLPDREVTIGAVLHAGSLALGASAVLAGSMGLWRLFGASVGLVGAYLLYELLVAWRRGRTPLEVRATG